MKKLRILAIGACFLTMFSCVSTKKFHSLQSDYNKMQRDEKNCQESLDKAQSMDNELTREKDALNKEKEQMQKEIDFLKKNNTQALNTLQDMSVMSAKQAASVKQSLETLDKQNALINNLQSAIARRDSLNMILVMNLKGAIGNINDKDINIKVEKGVVYIDISDKLLFNSGRYNVTKQAREVLGKVAEVLNAHPDIEFMVEGYTDNVPIHTDCLDDNWDLSVKRATSVIRILQNQYHMDPIRMTAAGHSEYIPVASNKTAEGRQLNRRTRIIILPQIDQFFKLLIKK